MANSDSAIDGIAKPVSAPATVTVTGGVISAAAAFSIKLKDYGITGAPIDGGKVAEYIARWHEKEKKVRVLFSELLDLIVNEGSTNKILSCPSISRSR